MGILVDKSIVQSLENSVSPTTGVLPVFGNLVSANKAAAQADSVATTVAGLVTDFNAYMAKLRAAGITA